jgi:hypothetical protein
MLRLVQGIGCRSLPRDSVRNSGIRRVFVSNSDVVKTGLAADWVGLVPSCILRLTTLPDLR